MGIYKTKWFQRWAKEEGLTDAALRVAVDEMKRGLVEADLGGGLSKKRVARPGQGKSGGCRTPVATNKVDRWFFVFGFAKNAIANIDRDEEAALKTLAEELLTYTVRAISKSVEAKQLFEVTCNAEK